MWRGSSGRPHLAVGVDVSCRVRPSPAARDDEVLERPSPEHVGEHSEGAALTVQLPASPINSTGVIGLPRRLGEALSSSSISPGLTTHASNPAARHFSRTLASPWPVNAIRNSSPGWERLAQARGEIVPDTPGKPSPRSRSPAGRLRRAPGHSRRRHATAISCPHAPSSRVIDVVTSSRSSTMSTLLACDAACRG